MSTITKAQGKKADEQLSSVVRETAVPAAVELLRANTAFTFPSKTVWLILLLKAESIGGLSRRHGRDEVKGSLIELISADSIQTLATAQMLAEESFGIIPTPETLARMDEFSMLTQASYCWAAVWSLADSNISISPDYDHEVSFADAMAISQQKASIQDKVSAEMWATYSGIAGGAAGVASTSETDTLGADPRLVPDGADDPTSVNSIAVIGDTNDDAGDDIFDAPPSDEVVDVFADTSDSDEAEVDGDSFDEVTPDWDDDEDVFVERDGDADIPDEFSGADADVLPVELAEEDTPTTVGRRGYVDQGSDAEDQTDEVDTVDGAADGDEFEAEDGFDDEYADEYSDDAFSADETDDQAEDVVGFETQDEVRSNIVRRFLTDDLDLNIDLTEFLAHFDIGAPMVQLAVPEGSSPWLGEQIAQFNRQANVDLAQLRDQHSVKLRTEYINLMSKLIEQVIGHVDMANPKTKYSNLRAEADNTYRERQAEREDKIRGKRAEIAAKYEAEAKRVAEQAALQAEVQYRERNRPKMEREQGEVVSEVERLIETGYSKDQQTVLKLRKHDAELQLKVGTSAILRVLTERHNEFLAVEEGRLQGWLDRISSLIDENRKADISRVDTLAEQQRLSDAIGDLRSEHAAKMAALESAHADQIRRMANELEADRQRAISESNVRDNDWRHQLDLEREKLSNAENYSATLLKQLDLNTKVVSDQWSERVASLQSDKDIYASTLVQTSEMQKRSTRMLTVIVIAMSLVMLATGFIVGAVVFAG